MSYLGDFLFSPARVRSPVKTLSGGERNRLLLARLFTRPANVLVMDEPTNDLDVESLELLEEVLADFSGTLLLVSHDRRFLDNVVTASFVFEGNGQVTEYVGGYSDWLRQRPPLVSEPAAKPKTSPAPASKQATPANKRKLSYNEQRELATLPQKIEALETQIDKLQQQISSPQFYKGESATVNTTLTQLQQLETELEHAYERWATLDA
jgi:ATP-binding cassette subfamily F protein uup